MEGAKQVSHLISIAVEQERDANDEIDFLNSILFSGTSYARDFSGSR